MGGTGNLDYVADEALHRANARKRHDAGAATFRPARVLDVGCAAGFFLDEARLARLGTRTGVELAPHMATGEDEFPASGWSEDNVRLPPTRSSKPVQRDHHVGLH